MLGRLRSFQVVQLADDQEQRLAEAWVWVQGEPVAGYALLLPHDEDVEQRKEHRRADERRREKHRHIGIADRPEDVGFVEEHECEQRMLIGKRESPEQDDTDRAA